jgi:hypothetical protein
MDSKYLAEYVLRNETDKRSENRDICVINTSNFLLDCKLHWILHTKFSRRMSNAEHWNENWEVKPFDSKMKREIRTLSQPHLFVMLMHRIMYNMFFCQKSITLT